MTRIDIISGFLGAGKTSLIKKLLEEKTFADEKLAIIENEYGEIGIDGIVLKKYGIEMKEMNSGCICCTIAGDFSQALKEMIKMYQPDRIMIEPSGVGKLSDVIKGCKQLLKESEVVINNIITVIDSTKYKLYIKNFAEFYKDQLISAKVIILSRTQSMKPGMLDYVINDIRQYNSASPIITTAWDQLTGVDIVKISDRREEYDLEASMMKELKSKIRAAKDHKYTKVQIVDSLYKEHHHADEVFTVWSKETAKIFDEDRLKAILESLASADGLILRAKGVIKTKENCWVQFDYVPGEYKITEARADFIGKICVIGEQINKSQLSELFGV